MMSSMLGGMGIPGLGRKSATRKSKSAKGKKGKKGGRGPTPPKVSAARSARVHAGHARGIPRPVANARRPQRAAPRSGRLRPVQAEVPGHRSSRAVRLHVRGLACPTRPQIELWIVDGHISTEPVAEADTVFDGGWILPGLVDAHCHVGLGQHGGVEFDEAIAQAETERDVGALLLRDCGVPIDTRSLDDRDDLPRIIRAGQTSGQAQALHRRPARSSSKTSRSCRPRWPSRRSAATAGSSWSATGSTARSVISPRCGPTTCSRPRSTPHTPTGPGSPRTSSARTRCPG